LLKKLPPSMTEVTSALCLGATEAACQGATAPEALLAVLDELETTPD
jgi:hypothetical protein